jgi:hypothetical protein
MLCVRFAFALPWSCLGAQPRTSPPPATELHLIIWTATEGVGVFFVGGSTAWGRGRGGEGGIDAERRFELLVCNDRERRRFNALLFAFAVAVERIRGSSRSQDWLYGMN